MLHKEVVSTFSLHLAPRMGDEHLVCTRLDHLFHQSDGDEVSYGDGKPVAVQWLPISNRRIGIQVVL